MSDGTGAASKLSAYGLNIRSSIAFPELTESTHDQSDVYVQQVSLSNSPSVNTNFSVNAEPDFARYIFPDYGTVEIEDGSNVNVDPIDENTIPHLRSFLLGGALGIVLHQRQFWILHACTVRVNGEAIAFAGPQTTGKSTLAAAFYAAGHEIMSDDLTVSLSPETGSVNPGLPLLKITPSAIDSIDAEFSSESQLKKLESLTTVSPFQSSKRAYRLPKHITGEIPLTRIYFLTDGDSIEIDSVEPQRQVTGLISNAFVRRRFEDTNASCRYLRQTEKIAEQVTVKQLQRPQNYSCLPDVVRIIEADLHDG